MMELEKQVQQSLLHMEKLSLGALAKSIQKYLL